MKTILVLAALFSTTLAFNIECDFELRKIWDQFGELYSCRVTSVTFTDSKSIEAVTGTHLDGKSNADVRQVFFGWYPTKFVVDFIPPNIDAFFPNFIGIEIASCKIHALNGDELKNYPNLEFFEIDDNEIVSIPGNLFEFNPKMKAVRFDSNKIAHIGSNLFSGLAELNTANFSSNACIDEPIIVNDRAQIVSFIETLKEKCPEN
jgi:hypothetical protein